MPLCIDLFVLRSWGALTTAQCLVPNQAWTGPHGAGICPAMPRIHCATRASHCQSEATCSRPDFVWLSNYFCEIFCLYLLAHLQASAQTDRQHALAKLAELEGVLQQALDQRAQASAEAQSSLAQLRQKSSELSAAEQQLQKLQQEVHTLQVSDCC